MICNDCRKKLDNGKTLTGCFSSDCIFYTNDKEMLKLIDRLLDPKKCIRLVPLTKKQIIHLTIFQLLCEYNNCHPESQHGEEIKKFLIRNKEKLKCQINI